VLAGGVMRLPRWVGAGIETEPAIAAYRRAAAKLEPAAAGKTAYTAAFAWRRA